MSGDETGDRSARIRAHLRGFYAVIDRDVFAHLRSHYTYTQNPQWRLGLALEREGLKPGDGIGVVGGPNASCTWAYVAHLRIVAELGGEPYDQRHPIAENAEENAARFWHSSPELRQKMGITATPLLERVIPWPDSMPQYTVGHAARIQLIEDMLKDFPGLHLVGNAYYGIGIPDCVRMAKQVAQKIIATS